MSFDPIYDDDSGAIIKVIGVGGGGCNAVNHMVNMTQHTDLEVVTGGFQVESHGQVIYYAVNTDAKALRQSVVTNTIQIGANLTKGLGAGAKPEIGRLAAEEDQDALRSMLEGADMVFIAAGMGGGTGTGAAPVVARLAKELGILTVAVVTKPFGFEGRRRIQFADMGIAELSKHVDSLIVVPNEKLLKVLGKGISLLQAFGAANDVLRNAVTGISDMITSPGLIGVDFADVRTVMSEMGRAMMGSGVAQGAASDGRAEKAAQDAVASPLLEDVDLSGARGVLVNITAGMDLGLEEFYVVGDTIRAFASEDATVIVGTTLIPEMSDEIRVTIVATGIGDVEPADIQIHQPIRPDLTNRRPENVTGYPNSNTHSQAQTQERPAKPADLSRRNILDTPISERLGPLKKEENLFDVNQFGRQFQQK